MNDWSENAVLWRVEQADKEQGKAIGVAQGGCPMVCKVPETKRENLRGNGKIPEQVAQMLRASRAGETVMRTCRKCCDELPDSEFGVNNHLPDRIAVTCKCCNREHTAKLRARARELFKTTRVKVSYALLGYR